MIDYDDNLSVLCNWKGSVLPRAALHALPGAIIAVVWILFKEHAWEAHEPFDIAFENSSSMWNAMTTVIAILVAFRIKQALGRFWEGTSLLHQMRGEWFDAASCLMTFSRQAKVQQDHVREVCQFRNTLVRLMSLMHGSALDEISGCTASTFSVLDIHGLDTQTLVLLRDCQARNHFSKVEALQHLIQVLVVASFESGILTIPAPILTRVFQTLSRGFVNLLNARKIKDTLFPLPFVQAIRVLLIIQTLFTGLIMAEIASSAKVWAAVLTFVPLFGLHALNLAAWQLEMPFGSDSNDLPLHSFQQEMNETLLMLVSDDTDHLPCTSSYAQATLSTVFRSSSCSFEGSSSHSKSMNAASFFKNRSSYGQHASESLGDSIDSNTRSLLDPAFFQKRASDADGIGPALSSPRSALTTSGYGSDLAPKRLNGNGVLESLNGDALLEICEDTTCAAPKQNDIVELKATLNGESDNTRCIAQHAEADLNSLRSFTLHSANVETQIQQLVRVLKVASDLEACQATALQRIEQQVASLSRSLQNLSLAKPSPTHIDRCSSKPSTKKGKLTTPRADSHHRNARIPSTPKSVGDSRFYRGKVGMDSPAVDMEIIDKFMEVADKVATT